MVIGVISCWLIASSNTAHSCGISWDAPRSHFEGVDSQGHVLLSEKLGELDAGEGVKLQVQAIFESENQKASPYLGRGWSIPILESKVVQLDEKTFRIEQPNGWFRILTRDAKSPNLLSGQDWKAEIQGDIINVWAECGTKFTYHRGRLARMHLQDRDFDFVYNGEHVCGIKEGGNALLTIEKSPANDSVTLLLGGNRKVEIQLGEQPQVQNIAGRKVVGAVEKGLTAYTNSNGEKRTIEYGLDENLNPTLTRANQTISWNSENGEILRDGEWSYKITPGETAYENAAIERTNRDQKTELWHVSHVKGFEISKGIDGKRRTVERFTSGILKGKVRQVKIEQDGRAHLEYRAMYDEKGNLIRELSETSEILYGPNGKPVEIKQSGQLVYRFIYNKDNKLEQIESKDKQTKNFL